MGRITEKIIALHGFGGRNRRIESSLPTYACMDLIQGWIWKKQNEQARTGFIWPLVVTSGDKEC